MREVLGVDGIDREVVWCWVAAAGRGGEQVDDEVDGRRDGEGDVLEDGTESPGPVGGGQPRSLYCFAPDVSFDATYQLTIRPRLPALCPSSLMNTQAAHSSAMRHQ